MSKHTIEEIERLIALYPTEAFEFEETNFVMISSEYYDLLKSYETLVRENREEKKNGKMGN